MFPDWAFDLLEVDHPIFRAYYNYTKVNYLIFDNKVPGQGVHRPAAVAGLNIGCRTAVILTPVDLSCGWDRLIHERGKRVLPGDAIRLGINLISYVAAERR